MYQMADVKCGLYFVIYIAFGAAQNIVIERTPMTFGNAFTECRDSYNGTLISVDQFNQHLELVRQNCKELSTNYWIGNYSTLSPYLELLGCFRYVNGSSQKFTIVNNTVAKCQARCLNATRIAIQKDRCQCLGTGIGRKQISASRCDILENGEVLGGKAKGITVYGRYDEIYPVAGDNINPLCYYGDCNSGTGVGQVQCSEEKAAIIGCFDKENKVTHNFPSKTQNDWWSAMRICLTKEYGYLMSYTYFNSNRQSVCGGEKRQVFTSLRQYKSIIVASDIGLDNLNTTNIVCRTANLEDGSNNETGKCNSKSGRNQHGFICITNREMSLPSTNTRCVVNTKPENETSSSSVTPMKASTIEIRAQYPGTSSIGRDGNEKSMATTSVIGAALGSVSVIIIVTVLIIAFLVYKRKKISQENDNQQINRYESYRPRGEESNNHYDSLQPPTSVEYVNNMGETEGDLYDECTESKYEVIDRSNPGTTEHHYEKYHK